MKKILYIIIGCISLGLGIIGVIVPILPTVPFVLLAAFCFAKSSEKLEDWFKNTKLYRENNVKSGMTKQAKIRIMCSVTLLMSIGFIMMGLKDIVEYIYVKKTMKQIPIYSDGNIIYDKLVTSKMMASNDLIAQIYKLCLKQSVDKIGWVYNCNFKIEVQQIVSTSEMISVVRKELNNTFDDIKRMRFNHMLKILKTTEGNKMISNKYTYGIKNYYYVFETMVDKLFDGIKESEKKKYNPNGYWQLNNQNPKLASSLRPDTILKRNGATYILDAKMYQYGVTKDVRDLPETQSIQK